MNFVLGHEARQVEAEVEEGLLVELRLEEVEDGNV